MGRVERLLALPGHDWLLDIPRGFVEDEFNLVGLSDVSGVSDAEGNLEAVLQDYCDASSSDPDEDLQASDNEEVPRSFRRMYYLLHQRYAQSKQGLAEIARQYEQGGYGRCRRWLCHGMAMIPCGESGRCGRGGTRLFCPNCRDLYYPPGLLASRLPTASGYASSSSSHRRLDGAAFGPSLPGLLMLSHPQLFKPAAPGRYEPKIFGFKLHHPAPESTKLGN